MLRNGKIKVAIVDDSAFMRKSLTLMLQSDEHIEIIGTARDGEEGYNLVKNKRPDVVTLDIEMPKVDGLAALERIMKDCPTPVLMVSSLTLEGAEATLKALELGAVDFIPKGMSYVNMDIVKIKEDLISKVRTIAKRESLRETLRRLRTITSDKKNGHAETTHVQNKKINTGYKAIAIGISTGGPLSLQKFLPNISPKVNQPIFIVQHMPPMFTKSLAERLNSMCKHEVKEAQNDEPVRNGYIYIAPGGKHMTVYKKSLDTLIRISDYPNDTLHKPSVDVMLNSIADTYGDKTLSIIMTGMGRDGTEGVQKIKNLGGQCIAQDENSCVVYGMPKSIVDSGLADTVVPLERIADVLNNGVANG